MSDRRLFEWVGSALEMLAVVAAGDMRAWGGEGEVAGVGGERREKDGGGVVFGGRPILGWEPWSLEFRPRVMAGRDESLWFRRRLDTMVWWVYRVIGRLGSSHGEGSPCKARHGAEAAG